MSDPGMALPPLPLSVIAGYLGAGKTTLVNRLLSAADGRKIMVLVNDFGDIAIDADLISARGGDTISLSNGCICCAIGGDLFQAFAKALDARPRPDHLMIEASGVAEPDRIANFARAEPELRLDMVVTLVDALNAQAQANDLLIGRTLHRQFETADLLMVTKTELAAEEQTKTVTNWLSEMCPDTPIVHDTAALDIFLGPQTFVPNHQGDDHDHSHSHEEMYEHWSFTSSAITDKDQVRALLENLPDGVLRLKGSAPSAAGPVEFHIAGRHIDVALGAGSTEPSLRVVAIGLTGCLPVNELAARFAALG